MTVPQVYVNYPNFSGGGGPVPELSASFVLVESTGSLPNARQLAAGPGIEIVDDGPGEDVIISATLTSSFITPTALGEVLFAATPSKFVPALPICSDNGWLVNSSGLLLVSASLS